MTMHTSCRCTYIHTRCCTVDRSPNIIFMLCSTTHGLQAQTALQSASVQRKKKKIRRYEKGYSKQLVQVKVKNQTTLINKRQLRTTMAYTHRHDLQSSVHRQKSPRTAPIQQPLRTSVRDSPSTMLVNSQACGLDVHSTYTQLTPSTYRPSLI
jgi:hypothetical protein